MEKIISINLTMLMVAFLVHLISCNSIPAKTASADIKFKVLPTYQHESIEEKFLGTLEDVDLLKLALKKIDDAILSAEAATIPGLGEAKTAITEFFDEVVEAKGGKINKKTEADAVKNEIEHSLNLRQIFNIESKLSTLRYKFQKQTLTPAQLEEVDDELYGIVDRFAKADSPFYKYPALAVKILLPLATTVESFMNELNDMSAYPRLKVLYNETEVPCLLQHALDFYLTPTMVDRFKAIRVNTDQHKRYFKYKIMRLIFYMGTESTESKTIQCQQINANKSEYESEVEAQFPHYKMSLDAKSIINAIWSFSKSLMHVQLSELPEALDSLLKPNLNYSDRVYLKDNLGDENVHFIGYDGKDKCVNGYFLLVRHRLNMEFQNANTKLKQFCADEVSDRYQITGNFFTKSVEYDWPYKMSK